MGSTVRLKVRQVEQSCIFDLLIEGQECSATLKYNPVLTELHQHWQRIYRKRYELTTRAKVSRMGGSGTPPAYDWDQELKLAEKKLLHAFEEWLGQAQLLEIRDRIQSYAQVDVLLECHPIDLARLPWELWLATPEAPLHRVRIARTVTTGTSPSRIRCGKLRVLAVLGVATDLDYAHDRQALRLLAPFAEIEILHSQQAEGTAASLKQQVANAIADERGWDVLFFAGHSDDGGATGGSLALTPEVSVSMPELESHLTAAKQRGLQLAIFNSCSGLAIAESLICSGVSQVVVMREPIADAVAHRFLTQFCRSLAQFQDVHTALLEACRYLASEKISYPSAYLIPSLFRHPDGTVPLFRIEPSRLKRLWQQWCPTRGQAIALGCLSLLSLMTPVRAFLSDNRAATQALYRSITQQLPAATPPPVTLLAIDQASIERNGIDTYKVKPMDRAYLAKLIDRLRQLNVQTIGIDYLLDGSATEDAKLATAVRSAVQQDTQVVFALRQLHNGQPVRVTERITQSTPVLHGDVNIADWQVMLPTHPSCQPVCPFAYQLAIVHPSPSPQIKPVLGLYPILDFSLPPPQVYTSLAAWDFLERPLNDPTLKNLQQQVVIIAAGGYDQADDNFSLPLAVGYWRSRLKALPQSQIFTGGEAHAYAVHHLRTQHLIWAIPDLWLVWMAACFGKGATLLLLNQKYPQQQRWAIGFAAGTVIYGWIGLQVYITLLLQLPWFLPVVTVWIYVLPTLRRFHD